MNAKFNYLPNVSPHPVTYAITPLSVVALQGGKHTVRTNLVMTAGAFNFAKAISYSFESNNTCNKRKVYLFEM